jgi:hypothetical protein
MMEVALVLPIGNVGITDASDIHNPLMPCSASDGSTTAPGSIPILQVPTGW